MLKKILAVFSTLCIASAAAAVDLNQASEADLDGIKGIGPATTRLIMAERKKAEFTSWGDFIKRVNGMGPKNALKYSAQGLTIEGATYQGAGNSFSGTGKTRQ